MTYDEMDAVLDWKMPCPFCNSGKVILELSMMKIDRAGDIGDGRLDDRISSVHDHVTQRRDFVIALECETCGHKANFRWAVLEKYLKNFV